MRTFHSLRLWLFFLLLCGLSATAQAYDGHGRLISYAQSGSVGLTHIYNGLGDRIATTTTPAGGIADTRRFVTAPDGRVMAEYGSSATDVNAEFIWLSPTVGDTGPFGGDDGLGGYAPIAIVTTASGGGSTLSWVHGDHLGTPIVITDATGTAIAQPTGYTATAFPGQSKTLPDLYYNRYRDYDPTTGRYIQADPIGLAGGANAYLYAAGNPVRYVDPSGLIVDTLADIAFLGYDIYRIFHDNIFGDDCPENGLGENLTAFGLDLGATFVPLVTGAGAASRVARNADEVVPYIKPGSRGGDTAGKPFPDWVKRQTKDSDPTSTCVYCRRPGTGTQVDHSASRATGGNATPENAQLACPHCNSSKGAGDFPKSPPPGYVGPWPPLHWPR